MTTINPFDLLGDDDAEDPSQLVSPLKTAATTKKAPQGKPVASAPALALSEPGKPTAKLPSKPLPPAQAVREGRSEGRGGGHGGGGRGYGRGRGGYNRDSANNEKVSNASVPAGPDSPEDGDNGKPSERRGYSGPRGGYRGGRRGGFTNGEDDRERPRRVYERHSGTGRGTEFKREGSGRGNWGTANDELALATEEVVNESEKNTTDEKPVGQNEVAEGNKASPTTESEEKKPENKEMTLEEYEKVLAEKRKALQALKSEERKVDTKQFESMQQLSSKKGNDDVFIKLGSDKDKRKEAYEKDEKAKKSVSINEFLKPAEGERYHSSGGRSRGRGSRGGYGSRDAMNNLPAPSIEDPSHFPTLVAK